MTCIVLWAGQCVALAGIIERTNNNYIDWEQGILSLSGIGMPESKTLSANAEEQRRTATTIAWDNLKQNFLRLMQSLRIDSDQTVNDLINQDEYFKEDLLRTLSISAVEELAQQTNGAVRIRVKMQLFGESGIAHTLFYKFVPPQETIYGNVISDYLSGKKKGFTTDSSRLCYTGLIIDARETRCLPSLNPLIYVKVDKPVYSLETVNFQCAIDRGTTVFMDSLDKARKAENRVGKHPLIINAIEATGPFRSDLRILKKDLDRIREANGQVNFLEKCKVIIVI